MKAKSTLFFFFLSLLAFSHTFGQSISDISSTNPLCRNESTGTITIRVLGGVPPYTYSIKRVFPVTPAINVNLSSSQPVLTFPNLPFGTYVVAFEDANGDGEVSTDYVTLVNPRAVDTRLVGKIDILCNGGATGSISVSGIGGTDSPTIPSASRYDFQLTGPSFPGGTGYLGNGTTSYNFTNLLAGTYSIVARDANGCIDPTPLEVTITQSVALSSAFTVSANTVCTGKPITLTYGGSGGVATYNWNFDGGVSLPGTGAGPHTLTYATTGTKTITLQVIDNAGCVSSTTSQTITVNETPVLTITNPAAVCTPATIDLTAAGITTGSTGGGTLTYWTDAAATTVLSSPNAVATSGTYYIKSTTAAGCSDIKPVTVTINPTPVLTITNPATVCTPTTVDLTAAAVTAGSIGNGTLTYWTDAAATTALANPNAVATTGTYYIKTATGAGCTDLKPVTVTINTSPALVITTPPAVCSPATVDLTAISVTAGSTGNGALTYWTDDAATLALANPNAVATSGTYYIKSTVATGCTDIKPVTVTINPTPVLVITNPAAVCTPATIDLTAATVTAGSTGGGTLSYWTDAAASNALTSPTAVTTSGTYYIKSTTAAGCTDIKPVTVTVNPSPLLVITNPAAVCSPATVNLTLAAVTAGSTGGGTLSYWTDAAATQALSNPAAVSTSGTYYIKSTTAAGCTDIKPVAVTINTPPALVITNPAAVCAPTTVDLTSAAVTAGSTGGGTLTYWTNAATTLALSNPSAVSTTGTYYIKSTSAAGCTDIKPVTVNVNPSPLLVITNPAAVCSPATVNLTLAAVTAGSTGSGTLSYWTDAAATQALSNPATVSTSGTYYIKSTTAAGCTDIKPVTVTISPTPVLVITNPSAVCAPASVDLTAAALTAGSIGGGTLSYWMDAAASNALASPTAVTASGTYYIKSTTAGGCTDIKPVTVTVNPAVAAPAVATIAYCQNDVANALTATGTNLLWYTAATGGTGSVSAPVPVTTASGSFNFFVSQTVNGCESPRATLTVTVLPLPVLSITDPAAVCSPATVDLTAATVTAGSASGTLSYWTNAAATTPLSNPAALAVGGTYFIKLTGSNGCSTVKPVTVTINATPVATFTYSGSPYCISNPNPSPTLGAGAVAGTFTASASGLVINAATGAINLSASQPGSYTVTNTVTASGNGGCPANATATVVITPGLTASVSIAASATTACAGTAITFTATPTNGGSAPTYQWKVNGVDATGANAATFTSSTLSNNDQVSVVMTAGGTGCITGSPATSNAVAITISNSLTASVSIAADQTTVCAGTAITFTATPTNGGSAPTYQWKVNGVNVNGATNATFTSSTLTNNDQVSVAMTAGGTGIGCITGSPATSNNVSISISNSLTASVSIAASATTICAGTPITFTATPTNGGSAPTYQWKVNGVDVTGANAATFTSSTLANNDQVSVVMTAGGTGIGCIAGSPATSNNVAITLSNSLTASVSIAASATTVCAGTPVTFTATPTNGGSAPTYQWRVNGVDVNGATNATFTSSTLANNDQVSVVMTAGGTGIGCIAGSPATSNNVAITISNSLTASVSIAANQNTVCAGTAITFTATPTNGGSAPTYQWKVNGTNVNGATNATFTSSTLANNDQVSVVMTAGGTGIGCITGSPATSNNVAITLSNSLTASVSIAASAMTVCAGTAITFTATPTNGGSAPTYQWKVNGVDVTGANAATFTSSTLANNDQVSVVMTAGGTGIGCITGSPATSNNVSISISNSLTASVSIAASATTVCAGTPITFTATPTNGGSAPTYQWKVNGVNVNGATNATFTSSTLANNDQVSVVMTAGGTGIGCITGSPATSNAVTITLSNSLTAGVSIAASATTVCAGTTVTFTATPTNGGSAPTYQWKVNGVDVTGANAATFTSSTLANNDQVSVVMTAGGTGIGCITGSPATSNAVGITLSNSLTAGVSIAASATTVCAGTPITFTATPTNGGSAPTYQWKVNGVDVTGANAATFTSNTLSNNDQVSVVMTAAGTGIGCITGSPATSNAVGITLSNSLTAGVSIAASATTVCAGTAITFTATPTNGGSAPTYQWKVNGVDVTGANAATFTSSTLANNDQVSVVMTAGGTGTGCIAGSPATSNAVGITLSNSLTAGVSIAASATMVCAGTPITFTATPTNGGSAPTYQWKVNGVNVNGATNATFTSSTLANNDQVSVIMTAGGTGIGCIAGSPATSNAIGITISNSLTAGVSIAASATTVCAGTAITFTATPTNGGSAPTYQWLINGLSAGATGPTFTSSTLTNNDKVSVIMTAAGTGISCITGSPATSNQINITISNGLAASVSIAASATTVCTGTAITFTATPANGGSAPTYQWKVNGTNVNGATNATFTSSTLTNNDQVSVVMTAGGTGTGCITGSPATSNAVTVAISSSLNAGVSITASANGPFCAGSSISFTATPTNGGSTPTYQWRVNGVNVNGATNATFTSSTLANNDQVSVVMTPDVSGSNGCVNPGAVPSNPLAVSVKPTSDPSCACNLVANAASNPVTCQGDTNGEAIALVLSGGSGQYLYSLNGGTPVSLDQIFSVFKNQPFGPFSITITDRNNTSCTKTVTENIGSLVKLVAQVNGTDPTCQGNDGKIEFAPFQTGNGGGRAPYQISINGGATFTQTATGAITFSNLTAGTYNVVISDGTPCTTSFAVKLNAAATQIIPAVAISTPSPTVCAGQPVTFAAAATNGGNAPRYQWQVNGTNVNGATNATFTSSTLTSADQVTVVMTPDQSGAGSCINPAPVTSNRLSVTPGSSLTPAVTISTPNASVCAGAAVPFTATPTNGGTNPAYQWRINGVNVAGANTAAFTSSTLTGTDVVTVVMTPDVTGAGSCIQPGAVTSNGLSVTISNNIAPSVSIATPAAQVCTGSAVTFTATVGNGGNSPAFQWKVNGVNVSNATTRTFTSSTLTSSDVVTVVMTPDQSGGNACINPAPVTSNSLSVTVSSSLTASVSVSASSTSICAGGTVTFTATPTNGGANPAYQWKINGVNVAGATTATFSGSNLNNNDQVSVVMTPNVSGSNSCVNPGPVNGNNVTITVKPASDPGCNCNLTVAAQTTNVTCAGGSDGNATLFIVSGGSASGTYAYKVGNGAFQSAPNFTGLAEGNYTFTVKDLSTNCQATTTVNLAPRFTVSAVIVVNQPRTCGDKGSIQFTNLSGGTAPYRVSVDSLNFSSYPANDLFANLDPGTYKATIKDANNCVFSRRISIVGAAPIIANLSKTDVSCNGGSNGAVTISNPSGGANNGYVYSMDGTSYSGTTSFTGLRAGNYTFYVKDAAGTCLQSFPVTMNEPAPIQVTANATQPASCQAADGQIAVVVNSGGTAPFAYRLNNGTFQAAASFTALGNGNYTLTVRDANGCQATRQVSLASAGAISATATVLSGASCNRADGSAQLTNVTGGSGSYEYSKDGITYQDSPLFQNLRGGNYLLIVRDKATTNRCTSTYPVTITEPLQLVATVTVTKVPGNCQASDGEITVSNVSGGQPAYQYSLDSLTNFQNSLVFAGLRNGNYKVYVRDSRGCYGIYSATLASPDAIRVGNAVSVVAPSCGGVPDGRINLNTNGSNVSGGQPGYLYSLNGGAFQTASLFSGLAAGAYQVKVKDQAGCELTFNYTLTDPAGISFDVVPTSAGCGGAAGAVEVRNVSGGIAPYRYSTNGIDFQSSITFANLAAGAYTMYVRDASLQTTCISRKAFNVSGSTAVQFTVTPTHIGCEGGDKGQITISNIVGGIPATGTARYQVSINGGQSFRDVTGASLVFDNLPPGNYEVVMNYGENLGCSTSARQVTITSAGVYFNVQTTAATCGEANGRAEAIVPNASASYSYSLEPNTGFRPSPVFTNLKPGVYTMYIRTGAVETCPNQRTFTMPGPAKLAYTFRKNNQCEGDECRDTKEGSIIFEITGGVLPYKVSVDNGANFTFDIYQDNYTVTGLRPGDYQIIVADATGCRTLPVPVKIEESRMRVRLRVEPSLPDEPTGRVWVQDIRGGTPVYEVNIDGSPWTPVRSPKLDTLMTGIPIGPHKLFIRDANGCIKCFNFKIEESKFTIPNIFTPNADTYNDTFRIRNLPDGSLLSIVNRWGKVVYQNSNYQNDWDGGTLPDAVYYYTLNVPGKGIFTGWVEVRRSE